MGFTRVSHSDTIDTVLSTLGPHPELVESVERQGTVQTLRPNRVCSLACCDNLDHPIALVDRIELLGAGRPSVLGRSSADPGIEGMERERVVIVV